MATYVIGDIQGCFHEFTALLEKINFSMQHDSLVLMGDLVNRGKNSLDVLRYVKTLQERSNCRVILGNHDLHLLAVFHQVRELKKQDTFQDVLYAHDVTSLCDWLRKQSLIYFDEIHQTLFSHAGVAPVWSDAQALKYGHELEEALQGHDFKQILKNLFGNTPNQWSDSLTSFDRLRVICNFLTRMRFCFDDGSLDFSHKGKIGSQPTYLKPWFQVRKQKQNDSAQVIFGHWAALEGNTFDKQYICVDTGCIWGRMLSAYRLEDQTWFQVSSSTPSAI